MKLCDVKLVAIERPGWVQVWRFRVETKTVDGQPVTLHGSARDDGRRARSEVLLATSVERVVQQIDAWSEGLIQR